MSVARFFGFFCYLALLLGKCCRGLMVVHISPPNPCPFHSLATNQYTYDSSVSAFTSSMARAIIFSANFTVHCDSFDLQRQLYTYSITIGRIVTKLQTKSQKKQQQPGRRRKVPEVQKKSTLTASTNKETVKSFKVRNKRSADQENVWYDMVPAGFRFRFSRLANGTVTEIRMPRRDQGDFQLTEVTTGIFKTLALLFNVNRNFSSHVIVENDDLGHHYSEFAFSTYRLGDFKVVRSEKIVEPDDFISNQFEGINSGKLAVKHNQVQFFDFDSGLLYNATGNISTASASSFGDPAMAKTYSFQVDVSYSLKLVRTLPRAVRRRPKERNWDELVFDYSNFSPQTFDDSSELQKILAIKEEMLTKAGDIRDAISLVVNELRKGKDKEANLLRGAILLESTLFIRGRKNQKRLLKDILPSATRMLVKSLDENDTSTAFRLLYVLSGGHGHEVNKIFLSCFSLHAVMENDTNRLDFFSALAQMQFPSDHLMERLFREFKQFNLSAAHRNAKEGNQTHRCLHPMITAGHLVGKKTLSPQIRAKLFSWFADKILKTFFTTNETACRSNITEQNFHYEPFFDAIGTFMTLEVVNIGGGKAGLIDNPLIDAVLRVVESCFNKTAPEFSLAALQSLGRLFHFPRIANALSRLAVDDSLSCWHRSEILNELVDRIDYAEKLSQPHVWPRFDVISGNHSIDAYAVEQFLNILDKKASSFDCNRAVLFDFLKKKKGRAWDELFERMIEERYERRLEANVTLHRQKRQGIGSILSSLTGGSGGSSSSGGRGGGFSFIPDTIVVCDQWNSSLKYKNIYSPASKFDADIQMYGSVKKHCIFDLTIKLSTFGTVGIQAGFFVGKNTTTNRGRMFGKAWSGLTLLGGIFNQDFATLEFSRYQAQGGFQGMVQLKAMGTPYINDRQDHCNMTYKISLRPLQWTLPAFRVAFSGFTFLMTADFAITLNGTLNPSYCAADGEMGARFFGAVIAEATAYAELENSYFGMGLQAVLNINYYIDMQTTMPGGCFYMYHGNDDMYLKFDFYIKIPSFVFINTNVQAVTIKQPWPIFSWQVMIKKSGRYVLFGICLPSSIIPPDAIPYYQT